MAEIRPGGTLKTDITQFFLLFILSVLIVYYTPYTMNQFFFLVLLLLFWDSKKDYFWIAFLFILYDQPNGFFSGSLKNDVQRLPIYTFAANLSLSIQDLFYFVAMVKAFIKGRKGRFVLAKPFLMLLGYFIFSYIISFMLGMDYKTHVQTLRSLIPFTMLFFVPRLMRTKEEYQKLFYLLFPVMFFVIAGQFYHVIFGAPLVTLLKKNIGLVTGHIVEVSKYDGVIRAIDSPYLNFFCLIGATFLAMGKTGRFKRLYHYSVISVCLLSMFLSATRGWIIAYALMMLIYFFFIDRNISNSIARIGIFAVFAYLILFASPVMSRQSEHVVDRVMTMKALMGGDVTAQGTLTRLNEHSPRVMKKFAESPIIGFGVSDESYKYADEHVGNQSMLLEMGVIGFLFFCIFVVQYVGMILRFERRMSRKNSLKRSLYVFIVGFTGLFVIHSSSTQIFGYILSQEKFFLVSLFFCISGFYMKAAIAEERQGYRAGAGMKSEPGEASWA